MMITPGCLDRAGVIGGMVFPIQFWKVDVGVGYVECCPAPGMRAGAGHNVLADCAVSQKGYLGTCRMIAMMQTVPARR